MKHTLWAFFLLTSSASAAQLGPIVAPAGNPMTPPAKIDLGKILFWEEQLSSDSTIACGTCHIPAAGGVDPRTSLGQLHPGLDGVLGTADDKRASNGVRLTSATRVYLEELAHGFRFDAQVTERQSMSHIGASMFPQTLWDTRGSGTFVDPVSGAVVIAAGGALESQAVGPILNDVEMAHLGRTWTEVVGKLQAVEPLALATALPPDMTAALAAIPSTPYTGYEALFHLAYGTPAITPVRIAKAIASYERTQHPDQTPWDLGTMTANQLAGEALFNGAGCAGCHAPPLFSDGLVHDIRLRPAAEDAGAGGARFKTPSLRNVGLRPAFFHNGDPSILTLDDVFDHYIAALGTPAWTVAERAQVKDFLINGLTDPRVALELPPFDRPKLNSERSPALIQTSGTATPGAGSFRPQIILETPPLIGNPEFKIGIHDVEGGATLVLQTRTPSRRAWTTVAGPFTAAGPPGIAGEGSFTYVMQLPLVPTLSGTTRSFRWQVIDSSGPCRSQAAQITHL